MEKVCFKCQILKPLSDFYKHKRMGDGHLNKCKDCAKKDVTKHREGNLEKVREYDRNRPNHKERLQRNKEYAKTDVGKQVVAKSRNNYRKKHKLRYVAKAVFGHAVRDGKILRPNYCSHCGIEGSPQGHHNDYNKPLDVVWVCVRCHTNFHNEVKILERKFEKENGYKIEDNSNLILEVAEWYWNEKPLDKVS